MSKVNKSADGKKSGGNWGKVKISGSLTPRPQPPNQIDITPKKQIHLSSQQIYDATASCSSRRCTHQWYKGELSKTSHHGIACPRTTTKGAPIIPDDDCTTWDKLAEQPHMLPLAPSYGVESPSTGCSPPAVFSVATSHQRRQQTRNNTDVNTRTDEKRQYSYQQQRQRMDGGRKGRGSAYQKRKGARVASKETALARQECGKSNNA